MKKTLTAAALAVITLTAVAGPASALNETGAGGSIRRCVHWINTTNSKGWPVEYCVKYR